jgi:uncharacterized phiE125 gp8 family phage protein
MLLFRPPLMRFGRAGVRPADFAALGAEPSPLDNDLPGLADRANAEWLWTLLTPLPSSGTTQVDDAGGYALVSPADGTYTQAYRGLVMPSTGSPQVYESTITTTVGVVSYVGVPAGLSAAASIAAGAGAYTAVPAYVGVAAAMAAAATLAAGAGTYTAVSGGPAYVGVAASMVAAATLAAGTATYTAAAPSDWMEPITVSQAKLAARMDPADGTLDPVVEGYISTARLIAEHETGREYVRKTKRYTFDDWPAPTRVMHMHAPSSVAVSYWNGVQWADLADGAFAWAEVDNGFGIAAPVGQSWPTLGEVAIGARVRVDATAGSAAPAADTPETVKTFIKACVAFWLDNPTEGASGSLAEAPRLGRLLDPERLWGM